MSTQPSKAATRAKHTPGPWIIGSSSDRNYMGNMLSGGLYVQQQSGGRSVICELDAITENRDANSRLIAAAPELLEIVKRLEFSEWGEKDEENNGWHCPECNGTPTTGHGGKCSIGQAIAKAEGKQA